VTIVIISTGGTIASVPDDGGAAPTLTAAQLSDAVPELDAYGPIRAKQFSNVPSAHLELGQVGRLIDKMEQLASDDDVRGIIVTQGTDVLEESAFFAALSYGGDVPVAFTGAMRNLELPGTDGPANLLASARVVADSPTDSVYVVFNDRVHDPADVTKTHTMNPDTFRSPEFGPLATVNEDRVDWRREPVTELPRLGLTQAVGSVDVAAVTATMDMATRQISAHHEADALCLAATGAGHIPPKIVSPLEELRDRTIPVVVTSRCPEGQLARSTYGFEGSERTLQELGCLYSRYNLQKTRIATILGVADDVLEAVFQRVDDATDQA
jgi:L-asparaginase